MYSQNILKQIFSHSVDEYPYECCGVILESTPEEDQIVLQCKNIQDELHKSDPEGYSRDARTAYTISPADLLKINRMTEKQGYKLKAIYHSHPDHDAYFSEEDHSFATFNNEPAYPGIEYIIVSIREKKVKEVVCFTWESKQKRYLGKKIS